MKETRALAAALALAVLQSGCASSAVVELRPTDVAWPRVNPRLILERIVLLSGAALGDPGRGGAAKPFGVAWHDRSILVSVPAQQSLAAVSEDRRIRWSGPLPLEPYGVASCPAGVVVTDPRSGRVALLDARLRFDRWLAAGLSRPTGVACVGDSVFVVETGGHRIIQLRADGGRFFIGERGHGRGRLNFPTALAFRGDMLAVGDTLNFRVQLLSAQALEFIAAFGSNGDRAGDMPRTKSVAIDRAGHIWVGDGLLGRVSLFSRSGELLLSLGGGGRPEAGDFAFPTGIAANEDGRVVVLDAVHASLQVFRVVDEPTRGQR